MFASELRPLTWAFTLSASLSVCACGGGSKALGASGGAGATASGGTGTTVSDASSMAGRTSDEQIPLPLVVDFDFFPSGAFGRLIDVGADGRMDTFAEQCTGDDVGEWDNVAIDQTDSACPTRPSAVTHDAELALSRCTSFVFTPAGLDAIDRTTWAGVLWQNTTCNWGKDPGSPVDPGANQITFWAWSNAASVGSTVVFQAGDIGSASTPYRDSFSAFSSVVLTATPTQYAIDLTHANYSDGVISAFGWTAERTDLAPLTFYVDGMRWE